jgi:hypothetical protein
MAMLTFARSRQLAQQQSIRQDLNSRLHHESHQGKSIIIPRRVISNADMAHHADAKSMLDDRGYEGVLIRGQNPALLMEKGRPRPNHRVVLLEGAVLWAERCHALRQGGRIDLHRWHIWTAETYSVPVPGVQVAAADTGERLYSHICSMSISSM